MHSINVFQILDEDDNVITTAETDPPAMSVSVRTTGETVDVHADTAKLRPLGVDGLRELFVACAQSAFAHRYEPLLDPEGGQQ